MDDQLLDVNTLAQLLDYSRPAVYRMIQRGTIKAIRLGLLLRLSRAELERLLREREQPPSPNGEARSEDTRAEKEAQ